MRPRPASPASFAVRAALTAVLAALPLAAARADGKLTARYTLSVAGVEVGRANIAVEATDTTYQIAGTGRVSGIARALSSGKGSAAAKGAFSVSKVNPSVFAMSAEADGKPESIRLGIVGNVAKEVEVEPKPKPMPDRIEVTDAHLANVVDPMSGAFVYVPGTVDMASAAACDRTIPVFDGRQRYDVTLSYLRTEQVKAGKTYAGPAVVCRASYFPVAGHRPTRSTVKYMTENKEMFVWLVPIAGTRMMAPFKVSIATMIGTAVLEASSFETEAKGKTVPVNAAPKP
ncbi:hypothetical protein GCM10007301_46960 [Azorhizobium oxalatiphilum]|uniref:DUF3108 domain-containing protein n=1 Tax=Azorhizobium oxalatiphilum TaxID=980631 RepID=A0A917FI66_9HYPH|nr:DUF3108 domain-containing protein [Azorhizobium oxalatiphilum]GGF81421.1 hypothetical protein GCM10007301_46960 [Azorhizobium oxalatiphilum]